MVRITLVPTEPKAAADPEVQAWLRMVEQMLDSEVQRALDDFAAFGVCSLEPTEELPRPA